MISKINTSAATTNRIGRAHFSSLFSKTDLISTSESFQLSRTFPNSQDATMESSASSLIVHRPNIVPSYVDYAAPCSERVRIGVMMTNNAIKLPSGHSARPAPALALSQLGSQLGPAITRVGWDKNQTCFQTEDPMAFKTINECGSRPPESPRSFLHVL